MSAEARVTAALLRQGRLLDQLSTGMSLIAAAGLLLFGSESAQLYCLWLAMLLAGLLQKYHALRVAFDAELFAGLEAMSLSELDQALTSLGLRPVSAEERSLAERGRGALRLLRRQMQYLLAQVLLMLAASGWGLFAS